MKLKKMKFHEMRNLLGLKKHTEFFGVGWENGTSHACI